DAVPVVAVHGHHRHGPVVCGWRMPFAVGIHAGRDMKAPRPGLPLLGGTVAVVVLAACSVISHAAYPYRPAGHVHSGPPHAAPPHSAPPLARPLPERAGAYWGVFEPGTPGSYQPVQRFTAIMGEAPRI